MFDCPHCGEPLAEEATFCRHCGSDAETGWSPDTDYHAVEIPEELEEPEEDDLSEAAAPGKTTTIHWDTWVLFALLMVVVVGLIAPGLLSYRRGLLFPVSLALIGILVVRRWLRRAR